MINNQCLFIGRLGQDISIKTFESGDKVGNVSMAVDDSYKNKQGEKVERTRWVNLVFRNRLCEIVEKYAPKGTQLVVQAKYAPRKYQVDNQDRWSHEFAVMNLQLIDSKPSKSEGQASTDFQTPPTPTSKPSFDEVDDDLPF